MKKQEVKIGNRIPFAELGKAKILTDDGQKKTTYIGLIVEEY